MAISTHYTYRDRHDANLKNRRFTEVNEHNEEYLGVLDINVPFFQEYLTSWKYHFRNANADADANVSALADAEISKWPLNCNNPIFNNQHYLQVDDAAQRPQMSCS